MTSFILFALLSAAQADEPSDLLSVESTKSGGFEITRSRWIREGWGDNTSLRVQYCFPADEPADGKNPRCAEPKDATVLDGGAYWLIRFPDLPEKGDESWIGYTYGFALNDDNRGALREGTENAVAQLTSALDEAWDAADAKRKADSKVDFSKEFSAALEASLSQRISKIEEPFQPFVTATGGPVAPKVLERLGISHDGTTATLSADSLLTGLRQVLVDDLELYRVQLDSAANAVGKNPPAGACATEWAARDQTGSDAAALLSLAQACANEHDKGNPGVSGLSAAVAAVKNATTDSDLKQLIKAIEAVQAPNSKAELTVLQWAGLTWQVQQAKAERTRLLDQAVQDAAEVTALLVTEDFDEPEPAKRRYWNTNTGFVYVTGLDDIVMPLFVSICPWSCLERDELPLDDKGKRFTSGLTADFGIKAATIDGVNQDPRVGDGPTFMVGASVYPLLPVVRLSAGATVFENTESRRWNTTPYVGATLDVIQAAELLNFLGFGVPKPPTFDQ